MYPLTKSYRLENGRSEELDNLPGDSKILNVLDDEYVD